MNFLWGYNMREDLFEYVLCFLFVYLLGLYIGWSYQEHKYRLQKKWLEIRIKCRDRTIENMKRKLDEINKRESD